MKRNYLSMSVPKVIMQLFISFLIGCLVHELLLEGLLEDLTISNWMKDIISLLLMIILTVPIFYLLFYPALKKNNKADQLLLEKYNQLKQILDNAPIGCYIYGENGFIYANKKLCSILAVGEIEIIGKRFNEAEIFDAQTNAMFAETVRKRLIRDEAVPEHYTAMISRKDGESIALEFRVKLGEYNGETVILSTVADVTEKQKLVTHLKHSEQLYRRLFESNMDVAIIMDLQGIITDVNKAGIESFGYGRSEIIGQHFTAFVYEKELVNVIEVFERVLQGESIRYETKIKDVQGEIANVAISVMQLTNDDHEISGIFAFIRNITEQKQHLQTIQQMAYFDSLTELPNRHYFLSEFENLLANVMKEQGKLALLYLDLDRLKIVNDHLGHFAGDELLRKTSERLRTIVGEEGFIARLGGDEFTIIYRIKNHEAEVDDFSEAILKGFETPFDIEGISIHSKISIGVALYPNHGRTTTTLVQSADSAMFQAKRMGGNQVKRFSDDIVSQSQKIFEFENDFSRAMEDQEFSLVYQPKIDANTLKVIAIEALIRWNHPVKGILRPSEFIPIAEKTGLISRLGDWVMREACFQMRNWQEQGNSAIRIAVNVSLLQFNQKFFPDKVEEILSESGLEPCCLEVEITKGTWAAESEEVYNGVARLKKMGVYVTLDNFGTGDSSISALKKYRYIDALKIDRSFIKKVDQNSEKAAIVQSIITLAHGLKMQVVAEGVETAPELTFIQNHDIDQFQGNYITNPLPPAQLLKYLKMQ